MGTLEKIENSSPRRGRRSRRQRVRARGWTGPPVPGHRPSPGGRGRGAAELLAPLAASDPRDVESRRLLAKGLAAAGQPEQALARLDEASPGAADDPEMAYLLGTEYLWLKRPEAAERLFAQVVAARPIPQTRILIGRAYRDAGEYGRARAELRAALLQHPGARRAHYYLGMVALADAGTGPDRLAIAIAEFQEELKLEPQDPLDQLPARRGPDRGRPAGRGPALPGDRGQRRPARRVRLPPRPRPARPRPHGRGRHHLAARPGAGGHPGRPRLRPPEHALPARPRAPEARPGRGRDDSPRGGAASGRGRGGRLERVPDASPAGARRPGCRPRARPSRRSPVPSGSSSGAGRWRG